MKQQLESANQPCELVPMDTTGDRMLEVPIPEIGSKGVFTLELESELSKGNIDLAVHSAKDMPSQLPDGFEILAYTAREQAHDVLVSYHSEIDLTQKLIIGTSSTRRASLFKHYYPHFETTSVRGNLQTRLRKLKQGKMDALVLAFAGIHRLGLDELIKYSFPMDKFVPAVGQGSMAIEISTELEPWKRSLIRKEINHPATEVCLLAERAYLFTIQGGCSIPAFAHAKLNENTLTLNGGIISLDGKRTVLREISSNSEDALKLGNNLGEMVLKAGGADILKEINTEKQ